MFMLVIRIGLLVHIFVLTAKIGIERLIGMVLVDGIFVGLS